MAGNRPGHSYSNIYNSDASRSHLGDVYNQYGPSPDQQTFRAVLDSLRYDGMDDRRDRLNSAERGTFEWALTERDCDDTSGDDDGPGDGEDDDLSHEGGECDSGSDEEGSTDDGEDEESGDEDGLWHSTKTIDGAFTDWLVSDEEEGNLFCFMGKPGSGKSTLMYASFNHETARWCVLH